MGQSATASLRYGIYIGGEEEWKLEEYSDDVYALTGTASWISEADDEVEDWQSLAETRLLAAVGFTETWDNGKDDGYWTRRREAQGKVLVEIEWFGTHDYSTYCLVMKQPWYRVNWGVEKIDLPNIPAGSLVTGSWDTTLREACQVLGITPTERPGWLLGASYG